MEIPDQMNMNDCDSGRHVISLSGYPVPMHMQDMTGEMSLRCRLRESLTRPENILALIITCGFLTNVQQGTDTNAILKSDPLLFKGIRVLTILVALSLAVATFARRRIPHAVCLTSIMLPFVLYLCACVLSVPFSAYPLLSLFKVCEIGLVILVCAIGINSAAGVPSDFFNLNVKIVLLYNVIIWVESILFPGFAWVKLRGETPLFGHALSGVFPVVNGNTVGLFGAVLFLAYLPRLFDSTRLSLRHAVPALIGLASVVCSYSRSSLLGLAVAALCSLILLRKYALCLAILLCFALLGTVPKVRTLTIEHLARGQEDRSLDTFSSHRIAMWETILSSYGTSVVGRGYAAGFRYDDNLTSGHAHNSLVELYFNVGLLGVVAWLLLIGALCSHLYRLLRAQVTIDYQLVSIVGVMVFMLMKALASTVFVYLDVSMLIMAGMIVYVMRRRIAAEYAEVGVSADNSFYPSY
jgi:O-antigen ligase